MLTASAFGGNVEWPGRGAFAGRSMLLRLSAPSALIGKRAEGIDTGSNEVSGLC